MTDLRVTNSRISSEMDRLAVKYEIFREDTRKVYGWTLARMQNKIAKMINW